MTRAEIKKLALACGFFDRLQDDGRMDLDENVYRLADQLFLLGLFQGGRDAVQEFPLV